MICILWILLLVRQVCVAVAICGFFNYIIAISNFLRVDFSIAFYCYSLFSQKKKKNPDLVRAILVLQSVNFICHTGIVVYLFTFSAWLV